MPKRVANAELPPTAPPATRIDAMLFILIDEDLDNITWIKVERVLADELGLADDWALLADGDHDDIPLDEGDDERAAASRLSCASYGIGDRAAALAAVRANHADCLAHGCDMWHPAPDTHLGNVFARGAPVGAAIRVWMCE